MKGIWKAIKAHRKAMIALAIVIVIGLGLGLGLGLTLPIKSVEVEGEVTLLQGEAYTGGFNIKQTTRAGLIHREDVLPKMLSGLDTSEPGEKQATVTYKGREIPVTIKVLGQDDVVLRIREGTLPAEYEPNDPFPTTGVFDLYYQGEIFRSAPIVGDFASDFSRRSGTYTIDLTYNDWLSVSYTYTIEEIIDHVEVKNGTIIAMQGGTLSKESIRSNATFVVHYKDGTQKEIPIGDDEIVVGEDVLEEKEESYLTTISFYYQGFEILCEDVRAYPEEAFDAISEMELILDRTIYAVGEKFDYSSAQLKVEYEISKGVTLMYLVTPEMVPEITFDVVDDDYKITATYKGEQASASVRVISQEDAGRVTAMSVTMNGSQVKGKDLNLEGAKIIVERGFGYREEEVPLTAEMVKGYDKTKPGTQIVTITFEDFIRQFEIDVVDPDSQEVTKILAVLGWDEPTCYSDDDIVIPEDACIRVEYGYGAKVEDVPITRNMISGFTPKLLTPQTLTITCGNQTYLFDNFLIIDDGVERTPSYLAVDDAIHAASVEEVDYASVSCEIGYQIGDPDLYTLAELIELGATVVIYDKDKPRSAYDMIVRYEAAPGLILASNWVKLSVDTVYEKAIRVDTSEAKTAYAKGEATDFTGMKLYLIYSDNSEQEIENYFSSLNVVEGFSTETAGNFTARVMYFSEELNTPLYANFNYSVAE